MIRFLALFLLVFMAPHSISSARADMLRIHGPNGLLLAAAETRTACDVLLTVRGKGQGTLQRVDQTYEDLLFVLVDSEARKLSLTAVPPGRWTVVLSEGAEVASLNLNNCDEKNES